MGEISGDREAEDATESTGSSHEITPISTDLHGSNSTSTEAQILICQATVVSTKEHVAQ